MTDQMNKKAYFLLLKRIKIHKNLIVLFFISLAVLSFVRLHVNQPITGDEPHYLIINHSLVSDKDFDLKNNYVNKDYSLFTSEPQPPHVSPLNLANPDSGWYSFHGIGLSIISLPFYLILGKAGVVLLMLLVASLCVVLLAIFTRIITGNERASYLSALLLLGSYFFNGLAGYIYPDLAITALVLTSFIIISSSSWQKRSMQIILGLCLGLMVLLHFRTIALAIPLGLIFLYLHQKKSPKRVPWAFLIPASIIGGIFMVTLYIWFGVIDPRSIYSSKVGVSLRSFIIDTPAILFDSLRGSIVYNPILFLIPIGLPLWYKYNKHTFKYLALLLPITFITFGFNEWHGGVSPNGRYLMGFLPVLFPAIAFFYIYGRSVVNRSVLYLLSGSTILISIIALLIKQPYTGYSLRTNIFLKIEDFTSIGFDRFFPTYFFIDNSIMDKYGPHQAIFWMGVLVILVFYGIMLTKYRNGESKNVRTK